MGYHSGIPFEFDNKEYFEFLWLYERLATEKKSEAQRQNPNGLLTNRD